MSTFRLEDHHEDSPAPKKPWVLVTASTIELFESAVAKALKSGYRPYGPFSVTPYQEQITYNGQKQPGVLRFLFSREMCSFEALGGLEPLEKS